ncbi:MAG: OB-fold nucleic acid binding domain-containing protein [Bacteroidales bacterium]|nr:OB-fold nucleic acid binding domain-containing protein [Bacteroidales bacterium]
MKKSIIAVFALAALVSCQSLKEEWQPVFTFDANEPDGLVLYTESTLPDFGGTFTSIRDLKATYRSGKPAEVAGNVWIKGQVISSDRTGNIYRELYIQDETGGIDLKLGKSSLYSDYQLGQWIYVYCDGLTLGAYNGMPQLGLEADQTTTNDYETSYIDVQAIIDQHVFRGAYDTPVQPAVITEDQLKASLSAGFKGELWGKLVTVKGLTYGNQIFALFYPNSNLPHTSANPENRIFLSDNGRWGVDTWACSKNKYIEYVQSGVWDLAEVGSGATRYGPITGKPSDYLRDGRVLDSFGADADLTYKEIMVKYAAGNYISHYFKLGGTDIQVRTSGFSRFADTRLDSRILAGQATVDITGILTIYSGAAQFSLVDDPSVSVIVH